MKLLALVALSACLGGSCCSTVTCASECDVTYKYYAKCGLWDWGTCSRYGTRTTRCYKTGVNGGWSSWQHSSTGSCSRSCGGGTRERTYVRHCNNPSPVLCGKSCPGNSYSYDSESCNTGCCPVSGGWSSWQVYSTGSCSRTCGGGTQTVTLMRWCNSPYPSCNGASCYGSSTTTEQRSCNWQSCPVNGGFSTWSLLTEGSCSVTCGGGVKTLTYRRLCNNPSPQYGGKNCTGDYFKNETSVCNNQSCPIDGSWSSWQWHYNGSCSVTCGRGLVEVTYRRECDSPAPQYGGSNCTGNNTQTETVTCDTQSCPVSDNSSSWHLLDNGSCSVTCGGGEMSVTYRQDCDSHIPESDEGNCTENSIRTELTDCNTQPCPAFDNSSSWYLLDTGSCSVTCGGGEMNVTYTQDCDSHILQSDEGNCTENSIRTELTDCNTQPCPVSDNSSSRYLLNTGSCSVTCGGGEMNVTYRQDCDSHIPESDEGNCTENSIRTKLTDCNTQPCPDFLDSDNSSSWYLLDTGSCSVTCGGGEMNVTYRQDCDSHIPENDEGNCTENSIRTELTDCNTQPCPDVLDSDNSSSWYLLDTGSCSVTCGGGEMSVTYRQDCDSQIPQSDEGNCTENSIRTELIDCNTQPCPDVLVSDNSSSWYLLDTGSCSVTCGGGKMNVTYTQDCDSHIPQSDEGNCTENSIRTELTDCNTQPCPDVLAFDNSSSWHLLDTGSCSVTCGGGEMNVTYTQDCDSHIPQSDEGNCTENSIRTELTDCNTQPCPVDGSWSSWQWHYNGSCSVTCGRGLVEVTYRRECDSPAPQYGGSNCTGNNTQTETVTCDTQSCPVHGSWSSWSPHFSGTCSVTCGGGLMNVTYRRHCDSPAPQSGGINCRGNSTRTEILVCNKQSCPGQDHNLAKGSGDEPRTQTASSSTQPPPAP